MRSAERLSTPKTKIIGQSVTIYKSGITTYWPNYYQMNAAKQKNCELLADAEYIDAVGMGLDYRNEPTGTPDYAHLDAQSMIELGKAFGAAALKYFD